MPEKRSKSEVWEAIQHEISQESKVVPFKKPSIIRRLMPLAVAACVALAVWFVYPKTQSGELLSSSQIETLSAPDGSTIKLSPYSRLSYEMTNDARDISLEGEAFFQVEKGNQFTVKTKAGEVKVLGTSFYVTERNGFLDVKCYTGKVEVLKSNGEKVVLTPGEGTNSEIQKYVHDSEKKFENEVISYDQVSLKLLLADVENLEQVSIVNTSSSNPLVSVDFKRGQVEELIEILPLLTDLKVKKVGEKKFELYKD